jgi:hypothetical protein
VTVQWAVVGQAEPGEVEIPSEFSDVPQEGALVVEALACHAMAFATDGTRHAQDVVSRHVEVDEGLSGYLDTGFELWRRDFLDAQRVQCLDRIRPPLNGPTSTPASTYPTMNG